MNRKCLVAAFSAVMVGIALASPARADGFSARECRAFAAEKYRVGSVKFKSTMAECKNGFRGQSAKSTKTNVRVAKAPKREKVNATKRITVYPLPRSSTTVVEPGSAPAQQTYYRPGQAIISTECIQYAAGLASGNANDTEANGFPYDSIGRKCMEHRGWSTAKHYTKDPWATPAPAQPVSFTPTRQTRHERAAATKHHKQHRSLEATVNSCLGKARSLRGGGNDFDTEANGFSDNSVFRGCMRGNGRGANLAYQAWPATPQFAVTSNRNRYWH